MLSTIIHGFLVSGSLIVAIGAQNAYVLKQGLLKQHVFWVCLICFLCDFGLMSLGVLGIGTLIDQNPTAKITLAVLGALFLLVYGGRAFMSAYQGSEGLHINTDSKYTSLGNTITTTLALTLLNPHVYLDTLVLIGGITSPLETTQKYAFLVGALSASFLWFFGLGFGARLLTPLFSKSITWRILDASIGLIMWAIAISLLHYAYLLKI